MEQTKFKLILTRSTEIIATVVLVVLFLLTLLKMLDLIFPSGTNLQELLSEDISLAAARSGKGEDSDLIISSNNRDQQLGRRNSLAAVLAEVHNSVKRKTADGIAWHSAVAGASLHDSDAVQTFKNSRATITFDKQNYLNIGENSMVVIQRMEHDPILTKRHTYMMIVDGKLSGRIGQSADGKNLNLNVITPSSQMLVKSGGGKTDAQFEIKINPDKSSTIEVHSGQAAVSAQGKTVQIGPNQAATIAIDQPPSAPIELAKAPEIVAPAANSTHYYKDLPPRVSFKWNAIEKADRYRLTVARDPDFKDILMDETVSQSSFTYGNLKSGEYFWRVAGLRNWAQGAASEKHRLTVIQDKIAPELQVDFPVDSVHTQKYVLKGLTEPGAIVHVGKQAVEVNQDGIFAIEMQLEQGANPLVVEARDTAGNAAYQSKIVIGQF